MSRKTWWAVVCGVVAIGLVLVSCARREVVTTVEVEVPVEVEVEKEVPVEVKVEVPIEVFVTATPEPPAPDAISEFDDVPDDVLVQVCEDVKQAIRYDDEARTLTIDLAAPFGPFMQLLSNGWASPLDQEWMVEQGDWDAECDTCVRYHDPVVEDSPIFNVENGTGPFRLDYWRPGEELSGVRFGGYWRDEPMWEGGPSGDAWYERVVVKNVSEWGSRFAMLQAGDVDIAYVPKQYLDQVEPLVAEECDYKTGECVPGPGTQLRLYKDLPGVIGIDFGFSMDIPEESAFIGSGRLDGGGIPPDFFADLSIRKAFASCFDYETLLRDVEKGEAVMRNGPIIAGMTGHDPDDPPTPVFDPMACELYFRAADLDHDGVPAGEDEDDVWEMGFFMMLAYNTGNDQRRVAAEVLKANIEALNENFRIELLALPWPAYLKQIRAGVIPIHPIGWLEDYHHPHNWVQPYLSAAGAFGYSLGLPEDVQAEFEANDRRGEEH